MVNRDLTTGLTALTLLDLVEAAGSLGGGQSARVALRPDDTHAAVQEWCERTGIDVAASGPGWAVIRRRRPPQPCCGESDGGLG